MLPLFARLPIIVMRRSQLLKATAQDVCVFCAFRSSLPARSSVPRRRYLQTSRSLARQQTNVAFEETDEFEFGGFAKEEAPTTNPSPPSSEQTQEPARGARGFEIGQSETATGTSTRYTRGRENATPARIRRIAVRPHLSDYLVNTAEANLSREVTSRWSIGRRHQLRSKESSKDFALPSAESADPVVTTGPTIRRVDYDIKNQSPWTSGSPKPAYAPLDDRFKDTMWWPARDGQREHPQPMMRTKERFQDASRSREEQSAFTQAARNVERAKASEYGSYFGDERNPDSRASTRPRFDRDMRSAPSSGRGRRERNVDLHSRRINRKPRGRNTYQGSEDNEERDFDVEEYHEKKKKRQAARAIEEREEQQRKDLEVKLPDFISIGSLATELNLRYSRFAQIMYKFGYDEVNHDFILSADDAALIVEEAGYIPVTESKGPDEDLYAAPLPDDMSHFPQRPPVVTIMGHVDHGKTTMLDYMRKSSIVASEHGGITQHIGAFSVPMPSGKTITFLDTPGHAAFLSMRQRGANVTDIVVLVVAADDSVMPQTLEALKHAKGANVPIIVALNKIDKPDAKPEEVKSDLARHGVEIEDYGGDVQVVSVSGKTGKGMPDLEDAIVALSEIQDRRAPVDGVVEGWVLESSTKDIGKVATVLIRRGTLRLGDIIVAGTEYCRVRTMRDEHGNQLTEVGPGMPAEIDGWRGQPTAGDEVLQADDEQTAHDVTDLRESKQARLGLGKDIHAINETRRQNQIRQERARARERALKEGVELPEEFELENETGPRTKNVYFIVKGDVSGSVEAVVNAMAGLGNNDVRPYVLRSAVGPVSEFDVDHATAAGGHVISFNMAVPPSMRAMAERSTTKILDNNVIYRLMNDVTTCLEDVLPPIQKSRVVAEAEIAQSFDINIKSRKYKKIAGCKVRNGTITRKNKVRVVRGPNMEVVFDGLLVSLKNVKKDVEEMPKGTECGIGFEDWDGFQIGDLIQSYEEWEERRTLQT